MLRHGYSPRRRYSSAQWSTLVQQTVKETDPNKLARLLITLCDILWQEQTERNSHSRASARNHGRVP
jgi:hypothetical protein